MGEKRKELKRLTFVSGGEIAEGVSKEIVKNQNPVGTGQGREERPICFHLMLKRPGESTAVFSFPLKYPPYGKNLTL